MSLTKRAIDAQRWNPDGPASQIAWDGRLPGFGVRVFESGARTFILDYRDELGAKRRMTLGRYGAITVEQARKLAQRATSRVADGDDPAAEKRARRAALTVRDFAAEYLETAKTIGNPGRRDRRPKKSWADDERRLRKYIVPALGARPLASITRADVAKLHAGIGRHATHEANRVLALLSVMFTSARDAGHLPDGHVSPTKGVTLFAEKSRERFVTADELPRLWRAIEAEPSPYVRGAIVLALLTGARLGELLRLEWRHVDFERGVLHLLETKNGRDHDVPLAPGAVELLRKLPRLLASPFVFPSSRTPGEHLNDIEHPWNRVRAAAGLEDVRFHDLRRTVGSWLAMSGHSLIEIGRVLNHASPATTSVYARLQNDATRAALDEHAARLLSVATTGARAG